MAYSEITDVNAAKSNAEKESLHQYYSNYFRDRLTKMDEQIKQRCIETSLTEGKLSNIFEGIAVYIDGYTEPSSDILREIVVSGGGRSIHWFSKTSVTHVIATQLARTKIRQWGEDVKCCRPEWITDSAKADRLLNWQDYRLVPESGDQALVRNQQPGQTIEQAFAAGPSKSTTPPGGAVKKAGDDGFISEFYGNSRLHHLSDWRVKLRNYVVERQKANNAKVFPRLDELIRKTLSVNLAAQDDDFDPFSGEDVESVSSSSTDIPSNLIMHIDLDCFFVSAGLLSRPNLVGQPVVVTHSTGKKAQQQGSPTGKQSMSYSEIASCSYEARAMGVTNGMLLGHALKLCPNLVHIPYEFDKYDEISHIFYNTLLSYTNEIEPVSCDEAYVDLSSMLKTIKNSKKVISPASLVSAIRQDIFEGTGCHSSAGIGRNRLVARLCTRRAKPNGQFLMLEEGEKLEDFISKQRIEDLPGVGYVMVSKLHGNFGEHIQTCGDLQKLALDHLSNVFGPRQGQFLYDSCRGLSRESGLKAPETRKSVSAEINYGMRFANVEEMKKFLAELVDEVVKRLNEANVKGQLLTMKLRLRSADAPKETKKFLGHGVSDAYSKSIRLDSPCNSSQPILNACLKLLFGSIAGSGVGEFGIFEPADVRGMGVQLTKLVDLNAPKRQNDALIKAFAKQQTATKRPRTADENRAGPSESIVFANAKTPQKPKAAKPSNISPPKSLKRQAQVRNATPRPNLIGASTLPEVTALIDEWIQASPQPCADDLEMIVNYLMAVCDYGDLSHVYDLLRFMREKVGTSSNSDSPSLWLLAFDQVILYSVQQKIKLLYGPGAMMPQI